MKTHSNDRVQPSFGNGFTGISGLVKPGTFERWYSDRNRLGQTLGVFQRRH